MLNNIALNAILFLDIETVPVVPEYQEMPPEYQALWDRKAKYLVKEGQTPEDVYGRAGIFAEFGKIVCISVGYMDLNNSNLRVKSFFDHDEKKLLSDFGQMLQNAFNRSDQYLCAHNGKEFDFPYIARRMLVNRLVLPNILDVAGKEPWKTRFLDTLHLWKFGDYKHFTSLNLLTYLFKIPTPKDDIDGSQVAAVYWKENDLERIRKYCQKDVVALVQLYRRYKGMELLADEQIVFVD